MAICKLLRILVRPLRRFNAAAEMFRPLNILTNQGTLKKMCPRNLDRGSWFTPTSTSTSYAGSETAAHSC